MNLKQYLFAPLILFALTGVCIAQPGNLAKDPEKPTPQDVKPEIQPEQEPERPGITKVDPGTDIKEIPSDTFTLVRAEIENDVLKITVTYAGGAAEHDFKLYWNGISRKSMPPQLPMVLKHNANGDQAEALITKTIEFNLDGIDKPSVLNIYTDHGGKTRVRYGEWRRP